MQYRSRYDFGIPSHRLSSQPDSTLRLKFQLPHLRTVGRGDQQDAAVGAAGCHALHLRQDLGLQPPARLVLACAASADLATGMVSELHESDVTNIRC